jgi:hypothetical protein
MDRKGISQVAYTICMLFAFIRFILQPIFDFHAHVIFDEQFSVRPRRLATPAESIAATSCGAGVKMKTLKLPTEAKSSIAISINSSNSTSYRLCNLISSLTTQQKQHNLVVDITVFSDTALRKDSLCGEATVIEWEPKSNHNR